MSEGMKLLFGVVVLVLLAMLGVMLYDEQERTFTNLDECKIYHVRQSLIKPSYKFTETIDPEICRSLKSIKDKNDELIRILEEK